MSLFVTGFVCAAGAVAQGLDVRVLEPPPRLGEETTTSLLTRSFPGLAVIPTGAGELVVRGEPGILDQAEALLSRLDRPPATILVEVRRRHDDRTTSRTVSPAVNLGRATAPSTFLRTTGVSRGGDVRTLRLQEGSPGTLFVGGEVPVVTSAGPFGSQVAFRDVGRQVQVHLRRVDPGRGAQLEFVVGTSSLGAATPAGPSFRRDGIRTQVYAPFGQAVSIGGGSQSEASSTGGPEVQVSGGGADGVVRVGRTRTSFQSLLDYEVLVREAP